MFNPYVVEQIRWELASRHCRPDEGGQTPCELRLDTLIDFKALTKLPEP